jgi:Zn-dependent metalloprotease
MLRNLVLATILLAPTLTAAQTGASERFRAERARTSAALAELRRWPGAEALHVDWPAQRTRPAAVRGLAVATEGVSDEARARAFLARHPALTIETRAGTSLRLVDVLRAHGLRAVRFQLFHRGLEVLGATVIVALDEASRVTALSSEVEPIALASLIPAIDADAALARARAECGATRARGGAARLAILAEGRARLVYRVRLPYPADSTMGRFHLVDATSGDYLGWRRTGVVDELRKEVRP